MTHVLVVLTFKVDIFTTACSFLSCSIRDLRRDDGVNLYECEVGHHQVFLHVLFLQHLDFLLQLHVVRGADGDPERGEGTDECHSLHHEQVVH